MQEMVYTCNPGEEEESSKKEVQVLGEWRSSEGVECGAARQYSDISLAVPKDLPVTGFPHSDLIDVGYFIHAVGKVG